MAKRNTDPKALQEALLDFVASNKLQKGIDQVRVEEIWYGLNPAFKNYTTSLRLQGDTLIVQLSSSVFRQELSYGKGKIIARINETIGSELVKKIILR